MRGPAALLILLGVLFGPAYWLFWERLSGSEGPSFELTEHGQRWTLPDGTILHFAKGQAYRPVAVALDPDMNRIGIRLSFESDGGTSGVPGADDYELTLLQGDQPILRRSLRITGKPGSSVTADAGTFDRGDVYKNILRSIFGLNETVALLHVEPFHGSDSHRCSFGKVMADRCRFSGSGSSKEIIRGAGPALTGSRGKRKPNHATASTIAMWDLLRRIQAHPR